MLKSVVKQILKHYDTGLKLAAVSIETRNKNLETFCNLFIENIREFLKDLPAADSRVRVEENKGRFAVHFTDDFLFSISINRYSERMEIIIDRERYLRYDGILEDYITNFATLPPATEVRKKIIQVFHDNIRQHLIKQIGKL